MLRIARAVGGRRLAQRVRHADRLSRLRSPAAQQPFARCVRLDDLPARDVRLTAPCTDYRPPPILTQTASASNTAAAGLAARQSSTRRPRMNADIPRSLQCLLVDERGQRVGVMTVTEALRRAADAGLDLVEVAPQAKPHAVCKLMPNARQHLHELQSKEEERRAKERKLQRAQVMKELRLSPATGEHDFQQKMARARQFLESGMRLRVFIVFKRGQGRLQAEAMQLLARARDTLSAHGQLHSGHFGNDNAASGAGGGGPAQDASTPDKEDADRRRPLEFTMFPLPANAK